MKFLKIIFLLYTLTFIISCGGIKEVFTNQKKNSSDEFLVEKKSPLVMPPEFSKLPSPEVTNNETQNNDIKKLITNNENSSNTSLNYKKENENFENSILEKIKKN